MNSEDNFPKDAILEFLEMPISESSYKKLAEEITIEDLIDFLNRPNLDPTLASLTLKSIEKCFYLKNLRNIILQNEKIHDILVQSSSNSIFEVRHLLSICLELSCHDEENLQFMQKPTILKTIMILLTSNELEIFQKAEKTLLKLAKENSIVQNLLIQELIFQTFTDKMKNCDEVVLIRLLGFSISLGKISTKLFEYIEDLGIYEEVLKLFFKKDLIVQISSVELLNEMASFSSGIKFLCKENFPLPYLTSLQESIFEPTTTALLYFLSECINMYPNMALKIFHEKSGIFYTKLNTYLIEGATYNDGGAKLICFITCWSNIISNPVGYNLMTTNLPDSHKQIAKYVAGVSSREVTICAISAWTKVLKKGLTIDLLKSHIESELIDKIMLQLLNDPFHDLRADSYLLIETLFQHFSLAADMFFNSAKHRELLLNTNSDTQSEAKIAKYNCAKIASKKYKNVIINLAGKEYFQALDIYIQKGPYYQKTENVPSIQDISL